MSDITTKGRLQRDLTNWFIDDQYKLFYKTRFK